MSEQSGLFYEFDSFRLDPDERVLFRDSQPVPLAPKLLDTLLVLVRESGHIVDKKDLMAQVWPDTFVEENNLSQHISALRRVLGDEARGSRFIETVPRRGYRFTAAVRAVHRDNGSTSEVRGQAGLPAAPAAVAAAGSVPHPRARTLVLSSFVFVAVAAALVPGLSELSGLGRSSYARLAPGMQAAGGFTIRTFDPGVWPRKDAEIGVTGYVIEDFEDPQLVDGLEVELSGGAQNFGPTRQLPMVFHPAVDDTGGAHAFAAGVWDGSRLLINRSTPPPHRYADFEWGDVTFHIRDGASSFGFSVHEMDLDTELSVNGIVLLNLRRVLPSGSTRGGYVRVDAVPGVPIQTVRVARGLYDDTGDGLAFDHVAFKPLVAGR